MKIHIGSLVTPSDFRGCELHSKEFIYTQSSSTGNGIEFKSGEVGIILEKIREHSMWFLKVLTPNGVGWVYFQWVIKL